MIGVLPEGKSVAKDFNREETEVSKLNCGDRQTDGNKLKSSV